MIKAQFTISMTVIQESDLQKFGYQISYTKTSPYKQKAMSNLFGDFYNGKRYKKTPTVVSDIPHTPGAFFSV